MTSRTIVIGDVHGCADELDALLRECAHDKSDQVVMTGDLVAKGPASRDVLAMVRELGLCSARGNHDEHVLRWKMARDADKPPPRMAPYHESVAKELSEDDWKVLAALPYFVNLPDKQALVVHGGLVPGVPLDEQDPILLMNLRCVRDDGSGTKRGDEGVLWGSVWPGPQLVLFGHHASAGLQEHPFAIGLDTGCVYGGKLSACILPERRIVSVNARRAYQPIAKDA